MFCELLSIKKPRYKKETTLESYRKMSNQNTKKSPGSSSLCVCTVRGRWEWIILAIWIAHFMVLLFCNKLSKKLWLTYAYSWTFPLSRIRASALLSGPTLHHSERTYFMDNSQVMLIILLHVRSVWKQKHRALEQTKFPIIYLYVKRKRRVFH